MRKLMIVTMVGAVALLGGCESMSTRTKGTLIGTGAGAGLGALIGSATGSWAWGAVIGAGAGALGGYIISDSIADDEERDAGRRASGYRTTPEDRDTSRRRTEAKDYFDRAMRSMDDDESESLLAKSVEIHPTASAYNNIGLLRLKKGDKRGAEDAWERALNLDPGNRAVRENLDRLRST